MIFIRSLLLIQLLLIILNITFFQTAWLLPNTPSEFKNNELAQKVLTDLKKKINSFEFFSKDACNSFEHFLINSKEIAQQCPIARIDYKKNTGFTVGYHTEICDPRSIWFVYRIEQTFIPFLNSLSFKSDTSFSFFVPFKDAAYCPPEMAAFFSKVPFLKCDKKTSDNNNNKVILIPDFFCLRKDFEKDIADIYSSNVQRPFFERLDTAAFRGALSGGRGSMENFNKIPRLNLLMLSHKHPNYIDARSTEAYSFYAEKSESGNNFIEFMQKTFGDPSPFTPFYEMTKYRYNISLDGWVSAWRRPLQIMFTGSVPLFQTNYETYFSPYLIENIHYVSFKSDMSDILKKIDWLRANPEQAFFIAKEAEKIAFTIMTPYFHKEFMHLLLTLIAQKFKT